MSFKHVIVLLTALYLAFSASGQRDTLILKKRQQPVALDSMTNDTLGTDTLRFNMDDLRVSPDALDAPVFYDMEDSMHLDARQRFVHLYGGAVVNYESLVLEADYIFFDLKTNIATAEGYPDSAGVMAGFPKFDDGDQQFEATKMRYNFKTRKGIIIETGTEQGDLNLLGRRTKFLAKGIDDRKDDIVYNQGAIFTTCTHPTPHFGIRSLKQKVIANKVAVAGASNLEIGGIPTPLWLPFGFFPLKKGQRAGLVFPRDYEFSPRLGFGLRNVGYYFPINDYIDAELATDIYMRGSFGLNTRVRYAKRYRFKGSVNLAFTTFVEDIPGSVQKSKSQSFSIRLNHNQDAKAHPYRSLGGSINFTTNRFDQQNFNDANNVLNNQTRSNFSFRHSLPGTPFRLSASFEHSQNTRTQRVDMTLPALDVVMQTIFPFKSADRPASDERWYDKIALEYRSNLRNKLSGTDTTFFSDETWKNARFGVRHNASLNASFNVFKYFTLTPNANLEEVWYANSLRREFEEELIITEDTIFSAGGNQFEIIRDTVSFGSINERQVSGFETIHKFNAGISMSTQIFGTVQFRKGWLRGFRHVIKPSLNLNYRPDYTREELGYFRQVVSTNSQGQLDTSEYSIFQGYTFGGAPTGGRQLSLGYAVNNIFEGKIFSKKDSTTKKFKIMDNLNITGNYNFAADSLKFSPINFRSTARFFKGKTTLNASMTLDPYTVNEQGRRVDRFMLDEEGKLFRFTRGSISLRTNLRYDDIVKIITGEDSGRGNERRKPARGDLFDYTLLDLISSFQLSHNFKVDFRNQNGEISSDVTAHSIEVRGSIPLSPNWNLNFTRIDYNFREKAFGYPDLGLSRDLHCWEMGINWQPVRGTYNFFLRVKPGSLDFIKVPYRQNLQDAGSRF